MKIKKNKKELVLEDLKDCIESLEDVLRNLDVLKEDIENLEDKKKEE